MGCSTPGLAVHHQLPEFTQTHVHKMLQNHLMKKPWNLKFPWTDAMDALPSCKKFIIRLEKELWLANISIGFLSASICKMLSQDFPGGTVSGTLPVKAGDGGSVPEPGRFHMARSS